MANEPILPARELESARNRVIETLTEHFANDTISLEDLERRIERVYAARTPVAIAQVAGDLPSLAPPPAAVAPAGAHRVTGERGERRTLLAFMSGIVRRGAWIVPARIRAVALMGGVEIDLRAARLQPVTDIHALAVMGAIVVTVPPGVRVEADGLAFLGGFEDQLEQPASLDARACVVRLRGLALMGGVEVKVAERAGPDEGPEAA